MKENTRALFRPLTVGGITINNRIVMPPMDTNYNGIDGMPTRTLLQYLRNRAKGGVGLIIQEASSVSFPEGKISARQTAINNPIIVPQLMEITDAVHAFETKIIVQLHHGGFLAHPEYCNGAENVSCSPTDNARELTKEEIKKIIQDFINSAVNAKRGGYDGVEIHAAHMYLLNQFLHPFHNRRTDEYGGSHENRFRIVKEIAEGIREACGRPFIIGLRLGAVDYPAGNTIEDAAIFSKMAEDCGIDMINLSIGFYTGSEVVPIQFDKEAPYVYMSERVKQDVSIPVAIVGKLRTPSVCASVIEEGKADMVCLGRQIICDPEWPNKVRFGKEETIRTCLNCLEGCMERMGMKDSSCRCVINPYVGYEDLYTEAHVEKTGNPRNILVVGGGIAGMQFSIIAAKQGHTVTLAEKNNCLGGQMILAGLTPFKKEVGQALEWFVGETERVGVKVNLNTTVTVDYVKEVNPDVVVLAAGCEFAIPPIEGIEHAVTGDKVITREFEVKEGTNAVIIGGGVVGCELAHRFILEGSKATVLEMLPDTCIGGPVISSATLKALLAMGGATTICNAKVTKVNENSVVYVDKEGIEHTVECDLVVNCAGQKKMNYTLYDALLDEGVEVYQISNHNVSNFQNSTREAFQLAYSL